MKKRIMKVILLKDNGKLILFYLCVCIFIEHNYFNQNKTYYNKHISNLYIELYLNNTGKLN